MYPGIAALLASSRGDRTDDSDDEIEQATAESLLRSVLDGLSFPTLVVSVQGEITHVNEPACEFFGVTADQAIGGSPAALHDTAVETPLVERALQRAEAIQERETTLSVGGEEVPVSRSVSLLYDGDGTCLGALAIDRDITERREQQRRTEALKAYQQERLEDMRAALTAVAAGDLTVDVATPEPEADFAEIAESYRSFAGMNEQLVATINNVRTVLDRMDGDAETLAGTSEDLSASTEEVTSSVQQIDASTTEMANGSDQLAAQAQQASRNVDDLSASIQEITASLEEIDTRSDEAAELASESVEDVEEAVAQIRRATGAAGDVIGRIDALESSMDEVEEIINIIAGIADQTNILALNANIEAARAGEAGEGFAVVADEVKALAEETRTSATDVAEIVETLRTSTGDVVDGIEDANAEVRRGADAIETVGDGLDTIADHVEATSQGVGEITDAVDGQASNAEQISAAIEDTSALAQETAASIQEIAAGIDQQSVAMDEVAGTAESLARLGEDLNDVVEQFKLDATETATVDEAAAAAAQQQLSEAEAVEVDADIDEQREQQTDADGPTELQPEDFE